MTQPTTRFDAIRAAAAEKPHGTRARYIGARCRCLLCRAANSRYSCDRVRRQAEGDFNGIVSAVRAQAHLKYLYRNGIGKAAVADAADVPKSSVHAIRSGRKRNIRARTERKILAVDADARSDRSLIPAAPTWRLLDRLLEDGYTKRQLATWLGSKAARPVLQLGRTFVTARSALKVERLVRLLEAGRLARPDKEAARPAAMVNNDG